MFPVNLPVPLEPIGRQVTGSGWIHVGATQGRGRYKANIGLETSPASITIPGGHQSATFRLKVLSDGVINSEGKPTLKRGLVELEIPSGWKPGDCERNCMRPEFFDYFRGFPNSAMLEIRDNGDDSQAGSPPEEQGTQGTQGDQSPNDQGSLESQTENPAPLQKDDTAPAKDYSELIATVQGYAAEIRHGPDHVYRWLRTLAALGEENGHAPLSAAEARQMSAIYSSNRWGPVAEALTEIEAAQTGTDDPLVCVSPQLWSDVKDYSKETWQGSVHVDRWLKVLHTFAGTANDQTIMLPAEAQSYANRGWTRWDPVVKAIECLEEQAWQDAL